MDQPNRRRPDWWDRAQRVMLALVTFSGEVAKVASAVRQIFR